MPASRVSTVVPALGVLAFLVSATAMPSAEAPLFSAADAIRVAIGQRVGGEADVVVTAVDLAADTTRFREAKPDPAARLGKPMRFTLVTASGRAIAVTASVTVTASHVVARADIGRGHVVEGDDVEALRTELVGTPVVRLPTIEDVVGTRALRPIAPGTVVLPAFVSVRHAVQAGDSVVVMALSGPVEVTATFVAVDSGAVGDTIRVRNPDTKKYVRGRIVKAGLVEVIHEK